MVFKVFILILFLNMYWVGQAEGRIFNPTQSINYYSSQPYSWDLQWEKEDVCIESINTIV